MRGVQAPRATTSSGLRWVAELQGGQEPQLVAGCRPEHITRLRPAPRDLVYHPPSSSLCQVRLRDQRVARPRTTICRPPCASVSSECGNTCVKIIWKHERNSHRSYCTLTRSFLFSFFFRLLLLVPFCRLFSRRKSVTVECRLYDDRDFFVGSSRRTWIIVIAWEKKDQSVCGRSREMDFERARIRRS